MLLRQVLVNELFGSYCAPDLFNTARAVRSMHKVSK